MAKFDEYITGLEGKENLDLVKVVQDLHDLYQEDVSVRDAKIEEMNGTIAEKDSAITAAQSDIQNWKAKNFDLAMQIPGNPAQVDPVNPDPEIDLSTLTIDDLFVRQDN